MGERPLTPDARSRAADLFETHAEAVARRLGARFPGADPQKVSDAVVRAILDLSEHPERHDAARAPLEAFLTGAAARVLRTLLRGDRRRRAREEKKAIDPVTAFVPAARSQLDELANRDLAERVREALRLTPEEDRALDLWLVGEKDLAAYVEALGLTGLPQAEQAEEVRRVLARLRQRIHRSGLRLRPEEREP